MTDKLDRVTFVEMQEHIKGLTPETVLNLKSRRQKDLFCGYFRARWGQVMEYKVVTENESYTNNVFSQIYNEGIKLLSGAKVEITRERMEKFMCVMRDTWFPGEQPNEDAAFPRMFEVNFDYMKAGPPVITMSIMQVSRNWAWMTPIIEREDFVAMKVEFGDACIAIEKLPEITVK